MTDGRTDLVRTTVSILVIAVLLGASFRILQLFLPAMAWAAMLVVATWPLLHQVQARLWNSRALAVTVMSLSIVVVFVVPFWLAIGTIVRHSHEITEWGSQIASHGLPGPPAWLDDIPLVGARAARFWADLADDSLPELANRGRPYAGAVTQWFVATMGGFGSVLLQFLLTVAFAAIMYSRGEPASDVARRFGARLAGQRGEQAVVLAARAIRGVALGVIVTAFLQAAIGTLGLVIVGIPFAGVLCAVMFLLCIAQLGPGLVMIPAAVWLFVEGRTTAGIVLAAIFILVISMDNFVRPLLIRRGADLPLLLILLGVIGGLVAFGLIGIFLGPTILAVVYTLALAWIAEGHDGGPAAPGQSGGASKE